MPKGEIVIWTQLGVSQASYYYFIDVIMCFSVEIPVYPNWSH